MCVLRCEPVATHQVHKANLLSLQSALMATWQLGGHCHVCPFSTVCLTETQTHQSPPHNIAVKPQTLRLCHIPIQSMSSTQHDTAVRWMLAMLTSSCAGQREMRPRNLFWGSEMLVLVRHLVAVNILFITFKRLFSIEALKI